MSSNPTFLDRPKPHQGPNVPYHNPHPSNPVLRGFALAPLAIIIRSSSWLQSVLWTLNGFNKLRDVPGLDAYSPRYDPTVTPVLSGTIETLSISQLQSKPRKNQSRYYTCANYHELYKNGTITPYEVAEYLISVVSRSNKNQRPDRHAIAFIDTKAELVLAAARASTERYKEGKPLSMLDGVPVAVKDEIELQGYRKMQGSAVDFTGPHNETGWCVRKWQEAGAIVIGKTNMHEIGLDTNGFNSTWGTPLNPHNEGYYTGGSSSGSACTVAQGVCPIALGADGGGSIRLPASFCGVYGLKPTHGRVSGRPTEDLANSVGVYGPIASNLDDLALAYRVMAQPDPESENGKSFPNSLSAATVGVATANRVIGIDRDWVARSDPDVLHMFEEAVKHYSANLAYKVVDIKIPYLPENQKAHAMSILSEVRSGLKPSQITQLSYQNQVLLSATGSSASAIDFLAAQRLRNMAMQHLAWLWEQHPGMLILTPTTPCAGWKIADPNDVAYRSNGASDSNMSLRSMEYVYFANWTGAPAISVPMGYTGDNVPVGLMAMGDWGSEEQLLAWAAEGEDILGERGVRQPPASNGAWLDVLAKVQRAV